MRLVAVGVPAHVHVLRNRRDGRTLWNNYSAYEIRILGAMVRLGRRDDAQEMLEFFLADRRPPAWNQWPEISWRNLRDAGHLGDVPHAWIGAEYVLAVLGMFAYERLSDAALVVAAGICDAWLDTGAVIVDGYNGALYNFPELRRELMAFGVSQIDAGSRIELGGYTEAGDTQCMEREQFQLGDIRSLDACNGACAAVDVVLHQAGLGSVPRSIDKPLRTHDSNVNGFLNILLARECTLGLIVKFRFLPFLRRFHTANGNFRSGNFVPPPI